MDTITQGKKYQPTRMCICCRKRDFQNNLLRLQQNGKNIILYSKNGRSFYICASCQASPNSNKKLASYLKIKKEEVEILMTNIKEKMFGQSSN